jgi:drug/metabolite transporter (DMT)-like permease
MAPNESVLPDEKVDEPPIEPIVFIPPSISTLSINDLPSSKKINWLTRFSGIIYTLTSSFILTCATFSIKQLGVDLLDALILRFIIQAFITYLFVLYKHYPLFPGTITEKILQILCCATSSGGFFLYFLAIRYVELSDVTTLLYTRVVWTVILSSVIYRERPSISLLLALPLTFLGVVFVAQPSFLFSSTILSINKFRVLGLTLSIMCSFTATISILAFKRLISTSKDVKASIIGFQYCLSILICLTINQLYQKYFLHTGLSLNYVISWKYILASVVCVIMISSTVLTQKAVKREHPAIFSLLTSSDIIFALILQNIFTTKRSNLFALLGSALVISSVVIIGVSKILNEKRQEKKMKLIDNHEEKF